MSRNRLCWMSALCFSLASLWLSAEDKADQNPDIAAVKKQYMAELEPINKRYRSRLEALKEKLTRKGDLSGALVVKAELDLAIAANPTQPANALEGTWTIKYDNGYTSVYTFRPDGTVLHHNQQKVGTLKKDGSDILINFNDGKLERITVKQNLVVEH
ncbi:MAG TPA: hypothetical protein VGM98_17920, partial [Schlesneria sp.]